MLTRSGDALFRARGVRVADRIRSAAVSDLQTVLELLYRVEHKSKPMRVCE